MIKRTALSILYANMDKADINKIYVGIDNGSSGSLGIIHPNGKALWFRTPVKKCRNYQKEEKNITRVDVPVLNKILDEHVIAEASVGDINSMVSVVLERPYSNIRGYNASLCAARALEATLISLEAYGLEYTFLDSKKWQHELLPGVEGRDELKKASFQKGLELFPGVKFKKDADSLLIAYWAKEQKL